MIYSVIVLRPTWFINNVEGFEREQDLQYVAIGIDAPTPSKAGYQALREAFAADAVDIKHQITYINPVTEGDYNLTELQWSDYIVLGHIENCVYTPWLNVDRP